MAAATPVPKANETPVGSQETLPVTANATAGCPVGAPGLAQRWAAQEASAVRPKSLVVSVLLWRMFSCPRRIKSDWGLCQVRETPPRCVGAPWPRIYHDLGNSCSGFCLGPFPRAQGDTKPGGQAGGPGGAGALLCLQQPASHPHPYAQSSFPWVHAVPIDPLSCHVNRHLAACAINGHASLDLPETRGKYQPSGARPPPPPAEGGLVGAPRCSPL